METVAALFPAGAHRDLCVAGRLPGVPGSTRVRSAGLEHPGCAPCTSARPGFSSALVVPTLGAYLFLVLRIERRRPVELAWHKLLPHGAAGNRHGCPADQRRGGRAVAGGQLSRWSGPTRMRPGHWPCWSAVCPARSPRRLVFRGILFRVTEEGLGTWPALAVSAAGVRLLHIANRGRHGRGARSPSPSRPGCCWAWSTTSPGRCRCAWASTWAGTSLRARSTASPFRDRQSQGWLVSTRIGPDWLTGGSFGAEASVVAVAISLLCSLALLAVSRRRQTLVAPGFVAAHPSTAGVSAG